MNKFLYSFLQCTWGCIQTLIGALLYLGHLHNKHYKYENAIVTEWDYEYSVSLGMFLFVTKKEQAGEGFEKLILHEYGHTFQSLLLGPLYMLVIGFPSMMWLRLPIFQKMRKKKKISYYSFYTEKWADELGIKYVSKYMAGSNVK